MLRHSSVVLPIIFRLLLILATVATIQINIEMDRIIVKGQSGSCLSK